MTATKPKNKNGQRKNAGRPAMRVASARPQAQAIALRMMTYSFWFLTLLVLSSSTVTDNIQKLVQQSLVASRLVALNDADLQTRTSLLRRVAANSDAVRGMQADEIRTVFGEPDLMRREGYVNSYHYASASCAMDVYFKNEAVRPAYVEYRLRDAGLAQGHQACVQSLFSGAKFAPEKQKTPTQSAAVIDGRV